MDYTKLADLLFSNVTLTLDDLEKRYPKRNLKQGAIVTRFAPSPTGFVHIGSVFTCLVSGNFANKSDGIFILRIEDTDQTREIKGATKTIIESLGHYNIKFDEGVLPSGNDFGNYGPYTQSKRKEIYMAMAKHLVSKGRGYPCFCTEEVSSSDKQRQEQNKELIGYYGHYARCRNLSYEEVEQNLKQGKKFAIRLRCKSDSNKKIMVEDSIRGKLRLSDNFNDVVVLKSDFLPPYNFAHVCDDHFMRVNLVMRGDEYIPSITEHLQIFEAMDFEPIQYAHVAPIQKLDGESKRKISKRKDPEANVEFYMQEGYPVEAVREYLLTVANSNFEDWRRLNPDAANSEFIVTTDKMSASGALFDLPKLNDVSKTVISKYTAEQVYDFVLYWAERYNEKYAQLLKENKDYSVKIFNIEKTSTKVRKDIIKWGDVEELNSYFYASSFNPIAKSFYPFDEKYKTDDIVYLLKNYIALYSEDDDKQEWFNKIKNLGIKIGFAGDMKEYKLNSQNYKGSYADVSAIIRIALTGRVNTPDMFEIMFVLGKEQVMNRLNTCINLLSK